MQCISTIKSPKIRKATVDEIFDLSVKNLYLIHNGRRTKVGISINVGNRFNELRALNRPARDKAPLKVHGVYTIDQGTAREFEQAILYNHKNEIAVGEWLRCGPEDVEKMFSGVQADLFLQAIIQTDRKAALREFINRPRPASNK